MGSADVSPGRADLDANADSEESRSALEGTGPDLNGYTPVPDGRWSRAESSSRIRERQVIRQATLICLAITLLPLIIVAALLAKAQIDSTANLAQAQAAETQALAPLNLAKAAQLQAQARVNTTYQEVNAAEYGKTPGLGPQVKSLQASYALAETELANAQAHFQVEENSYTSAGVAVARAETQINSPLSRWILYAGVAGAVVVGDMLFILYLRIDRQREIENKEIIQSIAESTAKLEVGVTDVAELWLANERQLAGYHQLVLNYAATSRATTKFSLWFGFLFIAILSVCVIFTHSLAATVASSVIAAVGTVVTGFIARAILRNSETSSLEVIEFFSHPLETQRVLTARQIIDTMPAENQAQAKLLLIKELMRTKDSRTPMQTSRGGTR